VNNKVFQEVSGNGHAAVLQQGLDNGKTNFNPVYIFKMNISPFWVVCLPYLFKFSHFSSYKLNTNLHSCYCKVEGEKDRKTLVEWGNVPQYGTVG
jgi:hypothetical protein